MEKLTLDAESLFNIADIIDSYCAKQREVVNVYYAQIMALESEWTDDETFGSMIIELNHLKTQALTIIEEVYEIYPKYFRKRAQLILERPEYGMDSTTIVRQGSSGIDRGTVVVGYDSKAGTTSVTGKLDNVSQERENKSHDDGKVFTTSKLDNTSQKCDMINNVGGKDSDSLISTSKTFDIDKSEKGFIASKLDNTSQECDTINNVGGKDSDLMITTSKTLDSNQGKIDDYYNTCGIVSCTNIARMAGLLVEDDEVLSIAINNNLCSKHREGSFGKNRQGGSTSPRNRKKILEYLGIDSYLEVASLENIAKKVEEGHGVIISVSFGQFYGEKMKGLVAVVVTSIKRDYDGTIQGFYICDSERNNPKAAYAFYDLNKLEIVLKPNRFMNVTSSIIR